MKLAEEASTVRFVKADYRKSIGGFLHKKTLFVKALKQDAAHFEEETYAKKNENYRQKL